MSTKIYVGGISYETAEEKLKEAFAKFGEVISAKIITDSDSGQSKGFGFIEMTAADEAQKAITDMNGKDLDGRKLTVNQARPQAGIRR